ncbi:MAG: hypothetical protein CM1200mP22_10850 [Dehalococcoidia bacterium]|nr:MAG: hypothetical protein CM1200mP22_10850 [Dehalococcoidia bacterium]
MEETPNKVLVITPHPDDADFWCSGTVAKWFGKMVRRCDTFCALMVVKEQLILIFLQRTFEDQRARTGRCSRGFGSSRIGVIASSRWIS